MQRTRDDALILFPGALGDFICFLPALCGLRARHRGRMLVVAQPRILSLLALPQTATASIDRREVADLFAIAAPPAPSTSELFGGFDRVYSWTGFGNADFAERLERISRGTVSVFNFRGMRPGEHAADYYTRCTGCRPVAPSPAVIADDANWWATFRRRHDVGERRWLVLHPGSGSRRKNWEGFGEVLWRWRRCADNAIVLLRGSAETDEAAGEHSGVTTVAGLSLPQVSALLRACSFYLGNDSGISHLAGAVGARGLVLFGPTDPSTWAPRGAAIRVLHAPDPCERCGPDRFCVHRLPVETVIGALESHGAGEPVTPTADRRCARSYRCGRPSSAARRS
jgi:heptosyltransferase-3